METTLEILAAKESQVWASIRMEEHDCGVVSMKIAKLESGLQEMYVLAVEESRKIQDPAELFGMWDKMTYACQRVINEAYQLGSTSNCPSDYNQLLDVECDCREKRDFFKCD